MSTISGRRLAAVSGGVLAALAAGASTVALASGEQRPAPPYVPATQSAAHTLAANQHTARADVAGLLASLRLPPGAAPLSAEPAGDHGWLKPSPSLVATTARATVHSWWQVPGSIASVIGYVEAHPPAGSREVSSGQGSSPDSTESDVQFQWPEVRGVLDLRELSVAATSLPNGQVGVLAQAQADWVVPRTTAELVPGATRAVRVRLAELRGGLAWSRTVRRGWRVRAIVRLVNSLALVQPGTYSCPELSFKGAGVLTLSFLGGSGAVRSRARYVEYPHLSTSGPCNPVDLTVGRRRVSLLGGRFVRRLRRLL